MDDLGFGCLESNTLFSVWCFLGLAIDMMCYERLSERICNIPDSGLTLNEHCVRGDLMINVI